jgi:hypothetical protein
MLGSRLAGRLVDQKRDALNIMGEKRGAEENAMHIVVSFAFWGANIACWRSLIVSRCWSSPSAFNFIAVLPE